MPSSRPQGGLEKGLEVQRKTSALVMGENGWWVSRDRELGLEGRGGEEGHLTGVRCEQNCELRHGDIFKRQSASDYARAENARGQTVPQWIGTKVS